MALPKLVQIKNIIEETEKKLRKLKGDIVEADIQKTLKAMAYEKILEIMEVGKNAKDAV